MFLPSLRASRWVNSVLHHRMAGWLFAALVLSLAILLSFGQLQAVFGFKSLLVIWGAYLGYWIARGVLRDYNPDHFLEDADVLTLDGISQVRALPPDTHCAIAFAAAVIARALIVVGVIFALALGA